MGRCGGCRSQTQRFCFVHQEFVCEACLVNDESKIHARCVVNTYRKWVQNSSYEWPPRCSVCSAELSADGDIVRRTCLHLEHAPCLENSTPPEHPCGACQLPLEKSLDSSEIGKAILKRIMIMQGLNDVKASLLEKQSAQAQPTTRSTHESLAQNKLITEAPLAAQTSPQLETPRTKFRRENAALQIIETDLAQNVSKVSPEVAPESAAEAVQMQPPVAPKDPKKPIGDTRLDIGLPKLGKVEPGQRPSVLSLKKEKGPPRNGTSASMRKALKAGNRRWISLRKALLGNQKQVAIVALFFVCICLLVYLMSGDDDDMGISTKPVVEDVSLPHIRVNPALVAKAKAATGRALHEVHDHGLPHNDED